jgi:hypothetical protein
MAEPAFDLKRHAGRMAHAWSHKGIWDSYTREAYDYAIPFRRPVSGAQSSGRTDVVFDVTAIDSTFRGAGQLKEDLFPSGQDWFKLKGGPLAKKLVKASNDNAGRLAFERQLENLTDQILPHFQTGEFDLAAAEMCLDIFAGTGILLPVRGDDLNPIRFVCLPVEECCLTLDGFRRPNGLSWGRMWKVADIKDAYPSYQLPEKLEKELAANAEAEVKLFQEFVREGKRWRCLARLEDDKAPPLRMWWRKAQPFVAARYHVVPGETYGRGPVMLALSTIKVVNKVKEMALRSAAINLLGLWGYRPGGAFNPDVHKMRPGAFWPVNSTGGMLGPDVARLDTPGKGMDVANIVLSEERAVIQRMLHDEVTDGKGKTPRSAEEILMIAQRIKRAYVGAFGRLINEIIPVLIPAVCEILHEQGLLTMELTFDQLLLAVEVTSPLAATLKAGHLEPLIQGFQLIAALGRNPDRELMLDELLPQVLQDTGIKAAHIADEAHKQAFDQKAAMAQMAAAAAEMATKNPELLMGGEGGQADPAAGGNVVPMRGAA